MDNAVAGDHIAPPEVPTRHHNADSWPAANVIHAVNHFEREVPDDAVTTGHALIGVLRDTGIIARMQVPLVSGDHVKLDAQAVELWNFTGLHLAAEHQIHWCVRIRVV